VNILLSILLSILKNPKVIAVVLGVVIAIGGIWLIKQNGALEEQLSQKEEELSSVRDTLESEREEFQKTISNYDEVMSSYLNQLADNQQSSQRLRQTISRLSAENDRLGQCLREDVPQELIDRIWEGQQ